MSLKKNRLSQKEYEKNFSDIHPPFETSEGALIEANRCLFCFDAPCTKLCPTSIDVPLFIKQIASGNNKGSAETILSSNIFGAGCARVCPVEKLCEGACVYNLLDEKPIAISKLQRYATEEIIQKQTPLFTRKPSVSKKVAIIGAGPAGLSCAHALSKEGIAVTVFEKEKRGGGLMTFGVAAYKVTSDFCQNEVNWITSLGGIDIQYGKIFGKDITLTELQKDFDAVFISIGVGMTRQLNIPGENSDGVIDAIKFIYDLRTHPQSDILVGEKVAVIGMGMTAIDAATQSIRLGAKEVTMLYRRTENEKPCTQHELDIARLDGCRIIWLAAPKEIISENGMVKKIICSKMKLGKPDASGRARPEVTNETFELEVDMIIKATGQKPFDELINSEKIQNKEGKISISMKHETNMQGVFAGGDAVNGGKEVVNAVQDGKDGAKAILRYLKMKN